MRQRGMRRRGSVMVEVMLMVMAMTGEENVEDEASPGPSILYNDGTYIKVPSMALDKVPVNY